MFDIPKFLILWGTEKPSKFNNPVRGDCRASLGLSSEEELEPSDEEEGEDDDDTGDDTGDERGDEEDSWLLSNRLLSKFALICR